MGPARVAKDLSVTLPAYMAVNVTLNFLAAGCRLSFSLGDPSHVEGNGTRSGPTATRVRQPHERAA
jgi:hypothetical protein